MSAAGGPELQIRLATPEDAEAIAVLWAECQRDSVWARLGPRLAEVHFRAYCLGAHELAVTAWLDGKLAGACLGTDRPADYGRALYAEHLPELARAFTRELFLRPAVVPILARRLRRTLGTRARGRRGGWVGPAAALSELGISSDRACYGVDFFVSPSAHGRQLGTLMLIRFCEEMGGRGLESCVLHTTADNVASQIAQQRAGFESVLRQGTDLTFLRRIDR